MSVTELVKAVEGGETVVIPTRFWGTVQLFLELTGKPHYWQLTIEGDRCEIKRERAQESEAK